jgi:hypothetical protein
VRMLSRSGLEVGLGRERHVAKRCFERPVGVEIVKEERHTRCRRPLHRSFEEEVADDMHAPVIEQLLVVRNLPVGPWLAGCRLRELAEVGH